MEFRLLGPLEAEHEGSRLPLGGPRQRALLALLLLDANRVVSRDRPVDELWPEGTAPNSAPKMVQAYVSQLRKVLPEGTIRTHASGYSIEVGDGSLDLHAFERLFAQGRDALSTGDARTTAERLQEALVLWRGPPLRELTAPFAVAEAGRLEDLHVAAHPRAGRDDRSVAGGRASRGCDSADRAGGALRLERRREPRLPGLRGWTARPAAGISEGVALAALFAAAHPERTSALALYGGWARTLTSADYPAGYEPERFRRPRRAHAQPLERAEHVPRPVGTQRGRRCALAPVVEPRAAAGSQPRGRPSTGFDWSGAWISGTSFR